MIHIYVDADACSVKEEVYRVARRYKLPVTLVANSPMRVPDDAELEVVGGDPDEADDWIVEQVHANDIVITADIPLAARCLEKGAHALGQKGRVFTEASMGEALASRELSAHLREHGMVTGGPAPFGPKDRSRFLQALDNVVNAALRGA